MKLSLLIPVYNEAGHLDRFFAGLTQIKFKNDVEFVVVDDCSKDTSWEIIERWRAKLPAGTMLTHKQPVNQGKGAALHQAIAMATGTVIAVQDADFEYDPNDIDKLVLPIAEGKADVVYGSRFRRDSPQVHRTFHYLVNRILTLLSNLLSGLYVSDMETCYKVFRADILKALRLETKRFGFEPEVTAKIAKLKVRVQEFPVSYFPRSYLDGKKISWKDGVAALWFIVKFNLKPLDPETARALPQLVPGSRQWL